MGTALGAMKVAASHAGLELEAYRARVAGGERWCWSCRAWHQIDAFGRDKSRPDGRDLRCRASRSTGRPRGWHAKPAINPLTGKPGPLPSPGRDGDRLQARARVNHLVETGVMPHPNKLACTDCDHEWKPGERRHEYDHHRGYAARHHLDVQPVCTTCHHRREKDRGNG
jgi:hypothetical protein